MTATMNTILILGATSGIGEQFARRYHAQGKKVIAAGRRVERLNSLKASLPGLEAVQLDVEDISSLETNISNIIKSFPDLDTVFCFSGKMTMPDFKDPKTTSTADIVSEFTANLTSVVVIAHVLIPHFLALKKPATFITVSSGLAYVPVNFPVYVATKGGIHAFSVALRGQLDGTQVKVLELAPPYVATDLDASFKEEFVEKQGGPEKAVVPMGLKEYVDDAFAKIEKGDEKEVAVGFSEMGVKAWRGAFGGLLEHVGSSG